MKVPKIVLTGGPGGGKTTAMGQIRKKLEREGYFVLTVPEAATKILECGLHPRKELKPAEFQGFVLDEQIHNEKMMEEAVKMIGTKYPDREVVILCDRGIRDQMAYVKEDEFKELMAKYDLPLENSWNRYDLVIHLVTSAIGAESFYKYENSPDKKATDRVRMETPEEAIQVDLVTQDLWKEHPNLYIVDNSTGFQKKIERTEDIIEEYLQTRTE